MDLDSALTREEMFQRVYAANESDAGGIPWALLHAHPTLVDWLDKDAVAARPVLVIACGLGDDAEELASRGWTVTAFDVSSTAIDWCHRRFPDSSVDYHAVDLFALPPAWRQAFDLVVEIRTLQSIEPARRTVAMQAVAACVRPGGYAFVHCLLGEEAAPLPESPPHPLTLAELRVFEEAGLVLVTCAEGVTADGRGRSVTLTYRRSQ